MEPVRHPWPDDLCVRRPGHGLHGAAGPYRTDVNAERRALQPIADAMGKDLDALWRDIVAEVAGWDEAGTMKASWLPRAFREGSRLYTLSFPAGWWIDITATETITALEDLLPHP